MKSDTHKNPKSSNPSELASVVSRLLHYGHHDFE